MLERLHKSNCQFNVLSTFYEVYILIPSSQLPTPAHQHTHPFSFALRILGFPSVQSFIWCMDEYGEMDVEREENGT